MNNNNLVGVVIDPGHGGTDSGATGNNQYEKDYTLKISKYMYDRFKELGIPVTLTRDSDTSLTPTERVNKVLSAYGNNPNVIVISNHLNAGGGTGAEVIYALRNNPTLASKILENIRATGQSTRKYYQRRLPSDTSKDYYFMHRNTGDTESLIVEYGFIDDTPENAKFLNDNYKQLAEAVIKAVSEYKGIKYTSPFTSSTTTTYTVKKGDSLYSIATKYNTTVNNLKSLNNLTSNTLNIGQVLKIPTTTTVGPTEVSEVITYIVKSGDTLESIAKAYGLTQEEIINLNNLTSTTLKQGQKLRLPIDTIELPNESESPTTNQPDIATYTVKSGDSLYSIANKYGLTVSELKNLNNLTTNTLTIGQVLKIKPTATTQPTSTTTYTVKSGDTLYSIANKYNTNITTLKNLNNLTSNLLSIGQVIKVPSTTDGTTTSNTTYTVKSGDTLYSIANKYGLTVSELKNLNNLTTNTLTIGQTLKIK